MTKPRFLDEAFANIGYELLQLFLRKHRDYGKGNILETGELGIAFRLSDKLSRLKHLLQNNREPSNESIEETWADIAVYAIIAILYRRKQFQDLEVKQSNNDHRHK